MKKRIGVMLCGCGHRDGSEVHEATLTLLALDEAGAQAVCIAPKGPQRYVRDHLSGAAAGEGRDMLVESARIARGDIRDIATVTTADFDALVIPGGQGAALNLSDFLEKGKDCTVHPQVERLLGEMVEAKKPIGAICIAPATLARVLQKIGISARLTLGNDPELKSALGSMGQRPIACSAVECVIDDAHRIVSTPAYISAKSIGELKMGIEKLVKAVIAMS